MPRPLEHVLPKLSAELALATNALAARAFHLPVDGSHDPDAIQIAFCPWKRKPDGALATLCLATSFARFSLCAERAAYDCLCDLFIPSWRAEAPESLPFGWRAVVATELWLARAGIGEQFQELAVEETPAFALAPATSGDLEATILLAGQDFPCLFRLDSFSAHRMDLLGSFARGRPLNRISPRFPLLVRLPQMLLSADTLKRLGTGDVIMGHCLVDGEMKAEVHLPGRGIFAARVALSGAVHIDKETKGGSLMEEDEDWTDNAAGMLDEEQDDDLAPTDFPPARAPLDHLPVKLDIVIASKQISLAELRTMGQGTTFTIANALSEPVSIRVNGQAIATGRLVQVDDRVAVQISAWPGFSEASDDGE